MEMFKHLGRDGDKHVSACTQLLRLFRAFFMLKVNDFRHIRSVCRNTLNC